MKGKTRQVLFALARMTLSYLRGPAVGGAAHAIQLDRSDPGAVAGAGVVQPSRKQFHG